MKIVIVTPEAAPFAKTGGLADVAGALPKALFRLGHEPLLIMPLYRQVLESGASPVEISRINVPVGHKTVEITICQDQLPGTSQ